MRGSVQGFQIEALMARFDLTETEWTIIAPLWPDDEAMSGPAGKFILRALDSNVLLILSFSRFPVRI
jgi:hypothetical protein